jgi:hypothetical protein
LITLFCDVCKAKLSPSDTGFRVKSGPMKGRDVHLCKQHADALVALLTPPDVKPGRKGKGKAGTSEAEPNKVLHRRVF